MGSPAAKQGDRIKATDTHLVIVPGNPSPVPAPHEFDAVIDGGLSSDVNINRRPAATVGSTATNSQPHVPQSPATGFAKPPANRGTISELNQRQVRINGKVAARDGDIAMTCNDPADLPIGKVVARGNVMIG